VESIIVALILAFVFRAFVVEAFVIPTGSMAPTLYGKHGVMTCANCGWEYAYGLSEGRGSVEPTSTSECPNCGYANVTSRFFDAGDGPPHMESGDRILVLKWPFDVGGPIGPRPWQVVVFKNPRDGEENFIKRLIAVPGDVVEIIDGDVFVAPADRLSDEARAVFAMDRRFKHCCQRWLELQTNQRGAGGFSSPAALRGFHAEAGDLQAEADALDDELRNLRPRLLQELDGLLHPARKTPVAQQALWNVVHDTDYPPRRRDTRRGGHQWQPAGGRADRWELLGRWLKYRGVGQPAESLELHGPQIDNYTGYNMPGPRFNASVPPEAYRDGAAVADLRIRCVVTHHDGTGYLRFALSRRGRTFWATLYSDGRACLHGGRSPRFEDAVLLVEDRADRLRAGRPVEVAFENVDYRLTLSVGGRIVLSETWIATPGKNGAGPPPQPHLVTLREIRMEPPPPPVTPPTITAQDLDVDLTHVVVEHDVFYTSAPLVSPPFNRYKLGGWGTTGFPILLRPGEYFVLGDNSPQSADSRLWDVVGHHLRRRGEDYQLGTVPEDQMIGRAFFVYWPSGLRTDLLPGYLRKVGWIPNVGRMRWIR
jgi:signal peptidase I